jgi:hypothetical protein
MRIKGVFSDIKDLDTLTLSYSTTISHLTCLSISALQRIIDSTEQRTTFDSSIYFHPNVRTDGWDEFTNWYRQIQLTEPALPAFPHHPTFWVHGTSGSAIELWPPSIFNPWIDFISKGGVISLDTAPNAIAGPSTHNQSPTRSKSSSLSPAPSTPRSDKHVPNMSRSPSLRPTETTVTSQQPISKLTSPPPTQGEEEQYWKDGSNVHDSDSNGLDLAQMSLN